MSVSDIDLQLRCSYQPEQGSTKIERVLASGTGAKIVTNHDEVCLIDIRLPAGDDARARYKSIDLLLKRSQIRPLAVGLHNDDNLIQLSYTAEVADSALHVLESAGLPGTLTLRDGFSLVALVGAGVCKTSCITTVFISSSKISRWSLSGRPRTASASWPFCAPVRPGM